MGCIFIPLAWDFFSIKKKMSDYYGEYLFSSPYVAFLISKCQKLSEEFMFSSPHGAYLISIIKHLTAIIKPLKVFVPSRGIYNLNFFRLTFITFLSLLFSSPPGAYLISTRLLHRLRIKASQHGLRRKPQTMYNLIIQSSSFVRNTLFSGHRGKMTYKL